MKTFLMSCWVMMFVSLHGIFGQSNEPLAPSNASPEEIKKSMNAHAATIALVPVTMGLEPIDAQFANAAAIDGMLEVKLGKLATTHAASMAVQKFGAKMVTDHDILNRRLLAIARSKRYALPSMLDATSEATLKYFQMLQGNNFDQAYVKHMIEAHRQAVAEFRRASHECHDPDLKIFAKQSTQIIEHHLQEIKNIRKKMQLIL